MMKTATAAQEITTGRDASNSQRITRIGILANAGKSGAAEIARAADAHLRAKGVEVVIETDCAKLIGVPGRGKPCVEVAAADLVLVLGGDGTILAASRDCAPRGTPMLPVHLGRFGFLTEVAPENITSALDAVLDGKATIQDRMMLQGRVLRPGVGEQASFSALNDIVVANGALARVLHLQLLINGEYVTTYAADGMIAASPTGSTAYSLSAGGPLVHPQLQTVLLTPICPHTLNARALLVPPDDEVGIVVDHDPEDVVRVTVDGQLGFPLEPGDEVRICRAPFAARIVSVGEANFYDKLQSKLRWGERVIY